jgi:hypothetical protein
MVHLLSAVIADPSGPHEDVVLDTHLVVRDSG